MTTLEESQGPRILIAEDEMLYREALAVSLRVVEPCATIDEAKDGHEALRLARLHEPDIVCLDIRMPGINGLDVAQKLREELPRCVFIIITSILTPWTIYRIRKLGIRCIVDKLNCGSVVITQAIQAAKQGEGFIPENWENIQRQSEADSQFLKMLSDRELEVLDCIANGMTDQQIGDTLSISHRTAATHRGNIFKKFNLHSTPELMNKALDLGFGKQESRVY